MTQLMAPCAWDQPPFTPQGPSSPCLHPASVCHDSQHDLGVSQWEKSSQCQPLSDSCLTSENLSPNRVPADGATLQGAQGVGPSHPPSAARSHTLSVGLLQRDRPNGTFV